MSTSSAAAAPNRESTGDSDFVWDVSGSKAIGIFELPIPTNIDPDGTYMIRAPPRPLVTERLQATGVTGPSRLQALYVPHFLRLEQELKALKKSEIVQAGEGIVARSVLDGLVPALGVVGVEAGGKLVFGSELGKHEARPTK